jgi:hypothetical protein
MSQLSFRVRMALQKRRQRLQHKSLQEHMQWLITGILCCLVTALFCLWAMAYLIMKGFL